MTFETFKKILDLQSEHFQKEQKLYEMGLDTIVLNESLVGAISMLWREVLTEYGVDNLEHFLYEKDYISGNLREDMKTWDENGNEIIKSVEELYEYLVSNSYFRAKNK